MISIYLTFLETAQNFPIHQKGMRVPVAPHLLHHHLVCQYFYFSYYSVCSGIPMWNDVHPFYVLVGHSYISSIEVFVKNVFVHFIRFFALLLSFGSLSFYFFHSGHKFMYTCICSFIFYCVL